MIIVDHLASKYVTEMAKKKLGDSANVILNDVKIRQGTSTNRIGVEATVTFFIDEKDLTQKMQTLLR